MEEVNNKKINKFEFGLILINTIALLCWIIFNNNFLGWLSWASYIFYMVSLYFYSVGKWQSHLFSIVSYLFYLYICIYFFYLGEIISTVIVLVVDFSLIFVWRKNQNKDSNKKEIKINKVNFLEVIFANIALIIFFVIALFVFRALQSNEILINAIMIALMPLTYYFSYRMSKVLFIYSFLGILAYLVLWLKTFLMGENVASIYLIGSFFSLIWTSYSLYNWTKMEKQQQQVKASKD